MRMVVLGAPGSTSSILIQRVHATVSTMTLPVPRLLRWARCMYGRRGLGVRPVVVGAGYIADGQRSLVLGPGSTVSFLVAARSSAGVSGERSEEREMLGLLTVLEGAVSRPGDRALLVPACWHACWS